MDSRGVTERAVRAGAALAVLAVLAPAASSAQGPAQVFAGSWSTFGGTGTVNLQVTDATHGKAAFEAYSGGGAGCGAPTVWYVGSYTAGSDSGQVVGCSNDLQGLSLIAWYKSGAGEQHGRFSVNVSCGNPNTFSGEYEERSTLPATTGQYPGTRTSAPLGNPCESPPSNNPPSNNTPSNNTPSNATLSVQMVQPASGWNQPTAAANLPAGSGAVLASPQLGPAQQQATVTVPLDQKTAMALVASNGPRKPGDCIYVALSVTNDANAPVILSNLGHPIEIPRPNLAPLTFAEVMTRCLNLLQELQPKAVVQKLRAQAASAASCHTSAFVLTQMSRRGRRYLRATPGRKPALIVSCLREPSGVAVHVRTRSSHQSLRSLVGPRLLVGLYRSRKALGSANVQATFSRR
jgi:hypothetical protein